MVRSMLGRAALVAGLISILAPALVAAKAAPPALGVSPSTDGAYDYGTVAAGSTASETFTVTNAGGSASGVVAIQVTGSDAFAVAADGCTGLSLGPSKSCDVTIEFAPDATGEVSATMSVSARRFTSSTSVDLSGTGGQPQWLFWVAANGTTIGRANLDGSGVIDDLITGLSGVDRIAVDGSHIYWSGNFVIGRADLDGGNVDPEFIDASNGASGVAVDGSYVYWTDSAQAIGRANLDGSSPNQVFIDQVGEAFDLAVNGTHLYWPNAPSDIVERAGIDGTGKSTVTATGSFPAAVALDGQHLYWTNAINDFTESWIGRSDLDGANADSTFLEVPFSFSALAVSETGIFWVEGDSIGRADLDGSDPDSDFITGLTDLRSLAVGP